ncbi:50S ribosomal protein L21 [Enterobacteriaceae endosymbiont of Plateumaris consimilis]|uniref:50S ribosomal protein L21 n=1 Tax=Enterobacteriaceae endosymbiont of Plateumaris consimilis TaxID=2675794 RepID=UPI00144A1612|nr:50S ribosomal protein L21 [Enterobacteriaceae endosymbiont of Plateumaris consimilis]QJC28849.1 50S ribosomal protein L21 [Enterobacteriaceae endosymbiont of Plateumaris consimilis]
MYAIFINGGKQYKVMVGQTIKLEKLKGNIGEKIKFNNVLLICNKNNLKIGQPLITGASITAELISHKRDKKIKIVKFHRRKHFHKVQGHRQFFTTMKIIKIKN